MSIIGNAITSCNNKKIIVAAWSFGSQSPSGAIGFERNGIDPIHICDNNYFIADTQNKVFTCIKPGKYAIYYFFRTNVSSNNVTPPSETMHYIIKRNNIVLVSETAKAGILKSGKISKIRLDINETISGIYSGAYIYSGTDAMLVIVED